MNAEKSQSASARYNSILQTNRPQELHSAPQDVPNGFSAPLHECLWNANVDQGWRNSGITEVDHKKHMIWGNRHKTFFLNLSVFLSRQGSSHCHSFCHWCGADPEAGWLEVAQAGGSRPCACCTGPSCKEPSLLTSASFLGNISLSKQRHRNHASKECYVCIFAALWTAGQIQTQVAWGLRSLLAPCQHQLRPGPEHTKNPAVQRTWLQQERTDWRLCRGHLDLNTWGHCSRSWRLLPLQTSPRHPALRRSVVLKEMWFWCSHLS